MTRQRRGGLPVTFYPSVTTTDKRGNKVRLPDMDNPIETTCAFIPERGSRAEVPGQQDIDVASLIVKADMGDIDVYSRAYVRGAYWDIVTPPQYHHGTRHVRHWTMEARRRP